MLLQPAGPSLVALMFSVSVPDCTHQTESMDGCLQVAKKAVTAAGYLCRGEHEQGILTLHINALLETAKIKSDVLPFAAGESLCFAFGGATLRPALSDDWTARESAMPHGSCVAVTAICRQGIQSSTGMTQVRTRRTC